MSEARSSAPLPVPVRGDLVAAHARYWQRLARPGSWWTGEERVAIAREVRAAPRCQLCEARKAALSPAAITGSHDAVSGLPWPVVEVVHRVITDPGRLSRAWFERVVADGLTQEQYVEVLGVVVAVISIDSFYRGIGAPGLPLPAPEPGAPSRYRPASAVIEDAWVAMIPAEGNTGAEADLWRAGRGGNVIRALSLVPDDVRTLNDLGAAHYLPNEQVTDPSTPGGALDRRQIELIAARMSLLNECFY